MVQNYQYGRSSRLPNQPNLINPRPENTSPAVQQILAGVGNPLSSMSGGNVDTSSRIMDRLDNTSLRESKLHHLGQVYGSEREDNDLDHLLIGGSLKGWRDFKKGFSKGFMGVINPAISVAKTLAPLAPLIL